MSKKPLTNEALVKKMMTFSPYGGMAQLFIMDAILKQAAQVRNVGLEGVKAAFGEHSMISPEAWFGVACDIAKQIEERR